MEKARHPNVIRPWTVQRNKVLNSLAHEATTRHMHPEELFRQRQKRAATKPEAPSR
jgi:hypothetical protein